MNRYAKSNVQNLTAPSTSLPPLPTDGASYDRRLWRYSIHIGYHPSKHANNSYKWAYQGGQSWNQPGYLNFYVSFELNVRRYQCFVYVCAGVLMCKLVLVQWMNIKYSH